MRLLLIIVIDALFIGAIAPGGRFVRRKCRRLFERFLRYAHDIAADVRIVLETSPRERMITRADPENAAKRHYRVGDAPGVLIDHHIVDFAQLSPWVL